MKKILAMVMVLTAVCMAACQSGSNSMICRVEGQMPSDQWDGKYMYLVPMRNADSIGVDSVLVQGDKFVIETSNVNLMSVVRMDYHFRYGLQDLLVVTEPGTVMVKIGEESSGSGTPQNEVLQTWKIRTQVHNSQYAFLNRSANDAKNDSVLYNSLKAKADSVHKEYRNFTRQLAKELKEGPLHDFLDKMFPKSYQKQMPDGTIQTVELD